MKRKILRTVAIVVVILNVGIMVIDLVTNGLEGPSLYSLPPTIVGLLTVWKLSDNKPLLPPKILEEQQKSKETSEKIQNYLANITKVR